MSKSNLNNHQKNSLEMVIKRLSDDHVYNEEMMELVEQVINNDHDGMLSNKAYWGKDKDYSK